MKTAPIKTWQRALWQQIFAAALPQSLLLVGGEGDGKAEFAQALAQRMLCEQPTGDDAACGVCLSCQFFAAGNHPDFRYVAPDAEMEPEVGAEDGIDAAATVEVAGAKKRSTQIRIEQVRELNAYVHLGSHQGGRRIILIVPAEAMNSAAANALLKILEEPPPSIYFILVATRWRRLLPTIISRCRRLQIPPPPTPMTADNPGRSQFVASLLAPGSDFLTLATQWEALLKKEGGLTMEMLVATMQYAISDLARAPFGGKMRLFVAHEKPALSLAQQAKLENILKFHKELLSFRRLAAHPLNARLFLDDLAARYLRAVLAT